LHLEVSDLRKVKILTLLLISLTFKAEAREVSDSIQTNKVHLLIGAGNYEALYAGLQHKINKKEYLQFALGIKPLGLKREKYYSGFLCYGSKWIKKDDQLIIPALQIKTVLWVIDNRSYKFSFIGINPELALEVKLNEKLKLAAAAGVIYNTMVKYKRKTYENVGWPREFQPSFSMHLCF
jgi:hypothetical protein